MGNATVSGRFFLLGLLLFSLSVLPVVRAESASVDFLSWSLPGAPSFLAVGEGTLYGASNAFLVLDASEPADLKLEGFLRPFEPGIPGSTVVSGNRAYVAWGGYGVRVLDTTDKAHPFIVFDNLDPAWSYFNLQLEAPLIFALAREADHRHEFQAIRIQLDGSLALEGALDLSSLPGGISEGHYPYRFLVDGATAFLTFGPRMESGPATLHVLSLSDTTKPRLISSLDLGEAVVGPNLREKPHLAMAMNGSYLYVTGRFGAVAKGDLRIVDVSDAASPRIASTWDKQVGAAEIRLSGSWAYLTDRDGALYVLDPRDALNPVIQGYVRAPMPLDYHIDFDLRVDGSWVYLHHWDYYAIHTVDVASPQAPAIAGTLPFVHALNEIRAKGGALFAAVWDYLQFYALDVSDPSVPQVANRTPLLGYGWGVDLRGKYAYVAMGAKNQEGQAGGLQILDVSNPWAPALVGYRAPMEGWNHDVAVDVEDGEAGSLYAYTAVGEPVLWVMEQESVRPGLRIDDVTIPGDNPLAVGFFEIPGGVQARDVRKVGNHAYLAAADGLYIVNVAVPTSPTLASKWGPAGKVARAVDVQGSYVYLAYANALVILNVSNPENPVEAARYQNGCEARDVQVAGWYAYVLFDGSLDVLDIRDPLHPILVASNVGTTYGAGYLTVTPPYIFANATGLFTFRFTGLIAPEVASVRRLLRPFRLKLSGSGFQQGALVTIGYDVTPWADVTYNGPTSLTLGSGKALRAKFSRGTAVPIRIVNPDGGTCTTTYTRP